MKNSWSAKGRIVKAFLREILNSIDVFTQTRRLFESQETYFNFYPKLETSHSNWSIALVFLAISSLYGYRFSSVLFIGFPSINFIQSFKEVLGVLV